MNTLLWSMVGFGIVGTLVLYCFSRIRAFKQLREARILFADPAGQAIAKEIYERSFLLMEVYLISPPQFGYQNLLQFHYAAQSSLAIYLRYAEESCEDIWEKIVYPDQVTTDEEKINLMDRAGHAAQLVKRVKADMIMLNENAPQPFVNMLFAKNS